MSSCLVCSHIWFMLCSIMICAIGLAGARARGSLIRVNVQVTGAFMSNMSKLRRKGGGLIYDALELLFALTHEFL